MIDPVALERAYASNGFYSLQLEVGDRCYQNCIYCYMNALPDEVNTLTDPEITDILDDCKRLGFSVIEWLGGEPLLRENIFEHMEHALDLGLRNNIWTGGLPLSDDKVVERCFELASNGLISVHLSTIDPILYEQLHPGRTQDDIGTILNGVRKLLEIGYPSSRMLNSVTLTGLQPPEDLIRTIDLFEDEFGIQTSLNVYQTYLRPGTDPGFLARFIPGPLSVAKVYARLTRQAGSNLPMNCVNKQYCSTTVAVLCDGFVTPCATMRERDAPNIHREPFAVICERERDHLTIARFRDIEQLPPRCRDCSMSCSCFGCRARAFAAENDMFGPDPRCFRSRPGIREAGSDNNTSC